MCASELNVALWRARLEAAQEPAKAAYQLETCRSKATNFQAIARRDDAIVAAWAALGVTAVCAKSAVACGSGAIEWLLVHGGLENLAVDDDEATAVERWEPAMRAALFTIPTHEYD